MFKNVFCFMEQQLKINKIQSNIGHSFNKQLDLLLKIVNEQDERITKLESELNNKKGE